MALLCIRTTPVDSDIPSPGELLFGRKLQGNLPVRIYNRDRRRDEVHARLAERQQKQKNYYDQHAHDLSHLEPGQDVRIQDHKTKEWQQGTIQEKCQEPRSYVVETENGKQLRRNRQHIRPTIRPVVGHSLETQARQQSEHMDNSTCQTNNEQGQDNEAVELVYRTRSGRVIRKPERYEQ